MAGCSRILSWHSVASRHSTHAILGMSVAITVMAFIVFAKPISTALSFARADVVASRDIAWPWYVLIGTTHPPRRHVVVSLHPMPPERPAQA